MRFVQSGRTKYHKVPQGRHKVPQGRHKVPQGGTRYRKVDDCTARLGFWYLKLLNARLIFKLRARNCIVLLTCIKKYLVHDRKAHACLDCFESQKFHR